MRILIVIGVMARLFAQTNAAQTTAITTPAQPPLSVKDRAWDYLKEALNDKNPDTRTIAVQAMGLIGPREPYMSSVEGMLDDKDVEVRLATISSLMDLKGKNLVPSLKKAMADDVPEVSFSAAKALWTLHDPSAKEALLSVLSGETKASSSFFTKQKRDALRLMHTPRPLMMLALKEGAGMAPVPGLGLGVSSLQGILSDPGVSGRAGAALLLAEEKDPRVLEGLTDALDDKEASVRAAACHAIAIRNDIKLEPILIPMLDDKKPSVRMRAAAACIRLESLPAPPAKKPPVKTAPKTAPKTIAPATKTAK